MNEKLNKAARQHKRQYPWLKPYQWKKGQSGNPKGGKPGKSMKTFVREYLEGLPDKDRREFLEHINPELAWRMAEGNPPQDVNLGQSPEMPFIIKIEKDDPTKKASKKTKKASAKTAGKEDKDVPQAV